MGKLIQFPAQRARRPRRGTLAFAAFGELAVLERAQLRLFAACAGGALMLTAALQLLAG